MDPQAGSSRAAKRPTKADLIRNYIEIQGDGARCAIDEFSGCVYAQAKLDIGNFGRHFQNLRWNVAIELGLVQPADPGTTPVKKRRVIAKRPIAIDKQLFLQSSMKIVALHNMPLPCFQWEGLKEIFDPISEALHTKINRDNIKGHLHAAADRIKLVLGKEMKGKLLSLKIDSASRSNRHILGINVQYEFHGKRVIRTLGMLEVSERQTAAVLKVKILEILSQYELTLQNIFSVTVDNGANMLAAVRQLKVELGLTANIEHLDSDEDQVSSLEHEHLLTESLTEEFQENINLVRCSIHTLQLAVLDVVKKSDTTVKEITAIAKKCRTLKYKPTFDQKSASYPPVWCQTRWSGIYKMMSSFAGQESFFRELGDQFPELDLTEHWAFIMEYERAFRPCFVCTNKLQGDGVGLSDFYMEWLLAIATLKKMSGNRFSAKLAAALSSRLELLKNSRAFKMALYLDPRFNFVGSAIFKPEEKEEIQTYLIDTWNRICKLRPSSEERESGQAILNPDSLLENDDVMDGFITEMFGGSLDPRVGSNQDGQLMKHIKALDVEPRQNCRYDVWQHWMQRKQSHPELHAVAMVVLATPASQASVERAFSALALVLTDRRGDLGPTALEDTLLIKLNKEIFERIFPTLYDWNEKGANDTLADF